MTRTQPSRQHPGFGRVRHLALAAAVACVFASSAALGIGAQATLAASLRSPSVQTINLGGGASPSEVTRAADGSLWVLGSQRSAPVVWRLAPSGRLLGTYPLPGLTAISPRLAPLIAPGNDGSLYVLGYGTAFPLSGYALVHIDPSGAESTVAVTYPAEPMSQVWFGGPVNGLVTASDGSLWLATEANGETAGYAVAHINSATGAPTWLPQRFPTHRFFSGALLPAPDGGLWIAPEAPRAELQEVSPTGALMRVATLAGRAQEFTAMASGSGGVAWVAARGYIARIARGRATFFALPLGGCEQASNLANGAGGNIWFLGSGFCAGSFSDYLGVITPRGRVTQVPFAAGGVLNLKRSLGLRLLAVGNGNTLWVIGKSPRLYRVTIR